MSNPGKPLEQGKEYFLPDEERVVKEMVREMIEELDRIYTDTKMLRQVHTKMHGCVKAEFTVDGDIPEAYKVGVFKEAKTFPAWIRFSNGHGWAQADNKRDQRGMAIKLMNVPGEKLLDIAKNSTSHDFILASSSTFFTRNLHDFRKFLRAVASENKSALLLYFLSHFKTLLKTIKLTTTCKHVLSIPFYSVSPYRFGDETRAVKYCVRPSAGNIMEYTDEKDPDYLKKNMVATLSKHHVCFDFCVQFQTDPVAMPIEDHLVEWKSPFIKLATIKIPKQIFNTDEQNTFGDNMAFNTWHSIAEHQPLGSLIRGRKEIYKELYTYRLSKDAVPLWEPLAADDFMTNPRAFASIPLSDI